MTYLRSTLPPIAITRGDQEKLIRLADASGGAFAQAGDYLAREIERAEVIEEFDSRPGLVKMGSRVAFRDDRSGQIRTVTLVYPDDADVAKGRISVLTPVGAALIGLSVGQSIEWETQAALDTILVAVGGGGLVGGLAAWYEGRVKIVAVEPEGAPTLHAALAAGRPVDAPMGSVAADSLAPRQVGQLMFPFARTYVDRVALVTDDAILKAQAALWNEMRIVVEPGGATAFAALLSGVYKPAPAERVGVLLCGANTTAVDFSRV